MAFTGTEGNGLNFIGAVQATNAIPNWFIRVDDDGEAWQASAVVGGVTSVTPRSTLHGIRYGLWESATSVVNSSQYILRPNQHGSNSNNLPLYMYGQQGYLDSAVSMWNGSTGYTGPLGGTFNYASVAHASKDQSTWADSTATSASLSANFTTQTVDLALAGSTSGKNWSLSSTAMPLTFANTTNGSGVTFRGSNSVIKVSTSTINTDTSICLTCNANVYGTFTGQNYAGAMLSYALWNQSSTLGLNVGGMVAFDRMPAGLDNATVTNGTAAPTGATVVLAGGNLSQSATPPTFSGGELLSWGDTQWNASVDSNATGTVHGAVGTGSGAIHWGEWAAGTTFAQDSIYVPQTNQLLWITAPEPSPAYLSEVLTGTGVYSLLGGEVTRRGSLTRGTVNSGTSLSVNFATQTVAINLSATINGHDWLASASNAPLQSLNNDIHSGFYADSSRSVGSPGYLAVTVDWDGSGSGAAVPASGNIAGQLVGTNMDGAILKFNLGGQGGVAQGYQYEQVQGVAALGAAVANDATTPYRMVFTSLSDSTASVPTAEINAVYNNANRVVVNSGNLTQFDGKNNTVQLSGTAHDAGSASLGGTTVNWGRWDAGTQISMTDRGTNNNPSSKTLAGGAHWVTSAQMTGPVTLPTTGTYSYSMVGNTTPTDQLGNTGTLNSASLQANFTTQTVNMGVNVTQGNATLNAVATGVPIQTRGVFMADSSLSGVNNLAVTCTGSTCGTTHQGSLGGGFFGAGGAGAALAYGLTKVGANAGTLSGVAVFNKQPTQ